MLSGGASAEVLIPGSVSAIAGVLETAGAGVGPARQIGAAWQVMTLPGWKGRAADAWESFVAREVGHAQLAPAALGRVASALMTYQSAFLVARAEAAAAIQEAAAAERATADARATHQNAVRTAALADPGTPEATVAPFTDPGVTGLTNAQARLDTARANLQRVGDEVAGEIHAAAYLTSGVRPGVLVPPGHDPNIDVGRGAEFLKGFAFQAWETILGLLQMSTVPGQTNSFVEQFGYLFEGPVAWGEHEEALRQAWANGSILKAFANEFLAWDLWEDHPAEAAGRVTFNIASLLAGGAGILKSTKVVKGAKAPSKTEDIGRMPAPDAGNRINARMISEELANGHAFEKHVIQNKEFPGVTTRRQFAELIEDVVLNGERRKLRNGKIYYWKDGVIVIRNPEASNGGTVFKPEDGTDGYDYFLRGRAE